MDHPRSFERGLPRGLLDVVARLSCFTCHAGAGVSEVYGRAAAPAGELMAYLALRVEPPPSSDDLSLHVP